MQTAEIRVKRSAKRDLGHGHAVMAFRDSDFRACGAVLSVDLYRI